MPQTQEREKGEKEQLATPVCTKNTDGGLSIAILGVLAEQQTSLESFFALRQSALKLSERQPIEKPLRGEIRDLCF